MTYVCMCVYVRTYVRRCTEDDAGTHRDPEEHTGSSDRQGVRAACKDCVQDQATLPAAGTYVATVSCTTSFCALYCTTSSVHSTAPRPLCTLLHHVLCALYCTTSSVHSVSARVPHVLYISFICAVILRPIAQDHSNVVPPEETQGTDASWH